MQRFFSRRMIWSTSVPSWDLCHRWQHVQGIEDSRALMPCQSHKEWLSLSWRLANLKVEEDTSYPLYCCPIRNPHSSEICILIPKSEAGSTHALSQKACSETSSEVCPTFKDLRQTLSKFCDILWLHGGHISKDWEILIDATFAPDARLKVSIHIQKAVDLTWQMRGSP